MIEVPPKTSAAAKRVVERVAKHNVTVYEPDDSPEQQAVANELVAMSGYSCLKVWRENPHLLWVFDQDVAFKGRRLNLPR